MLHSKFDVSDALPLVSTYPLPVAAEPARTAGRMIALLVVACLPLLLTFLLLRLIGESFLTAGRGLAIFFRSFAEEYGRPC